MQEVELAGAISRAVAEYGVLGLGWIGWFFERRRTNKLTTQLINFLAKQELIKESGNVL